MITGTIGSYLKNMGLQQKWQKKKDDLHLAASPKVVTKTAANQKGGIYTAAVESFMKEQDELRRKINSLLQETTECSRASVELKLQYGGKLSPREMEYIRNNCPDLYSKAMEREKERGQYAAQLRNCNSTEEVFALRIGKLASLMGECQAAENRGDYGASFELRARLYNIEEEHDDYIKSDAYQELCRKEKAEKEADAEKARAKKEAEAETVKENQEDKAAEKATDTQGDEAAEKATDTQGDEVAEKATDTQGDEVAEKVTDTQEFEGTKETKDFSEGKLRGEKNAEQSDGMSIPGEGKIPETNPRLAKKQQLPGTNRDIPEIKTNPAAGKHSHHTQEYHYEHLAENKIKSAADKYQKNNPAILPGTFDVKSDVPLDSGLETTGSVVAEIKGNLSINI